jgi:hypothetical protein
MKIIEKFNLLCATPSDINEHLPKLKEYGEKCNHITEMGVRGVVSTWAFLAANPEKLVSYDIYTDSRLAEAIEAAKEENIDFNFIEQNVLEADIEETDFLFIDTYHTASQLEKELALHAGKVARYIGFHDTTTFWINGEPPYEGINHNGLSCGRGLKFALETFLANNPDWVIAYRTDANNGLTIIERTRKSS